MQNELQNLKENRNMMRDLGKDLEKENVLLKNQMDSIKSQNMEL
jgi:hypothetical protein